MQQRFLLQILLLAQDVSGTTMPIIRSSRVLYRWLLCVVFRAVVFKLLVWCGAEGYVSSLQDSAAENKMPTRCNRGFYCRSYCLLNMFRAPLCSSSGAQEYYTRGCCLWYFVLWFSSCRSGVELWVVCDAYRKPDTLPTALDQMGNLKTTAPNTTGSNHCIILLSS